MSTLDKKNRQLYIQAVSGGTGPIGVYKGSSSFKNMG